MLPADPHVRAITGTRIAVATTAAQPQLYSSLAHPTAPVHSHLPQIADEHPKHAVAVFMGRRSESPAGVAATRRRRAHGGARDGDGLRDVEHRHGSLEEARVGVQAVRGNALAQPCRVREVLRLEVLVPAVQRVEALLPQLLVPAGTNICLKLNARVLPFIPEREITQLQRQSQQVA